MTSPERQHSDEHSGNGQTISPSFMARRFPLNSSFNSQSQTGYAGPPPLLDLDPNRSRTSTMPPSTPQHVNRGTPAVAATGAGSSNSPSHGPAPPATTSGGDTVAVDVQGYFSSQEGGLVPTELPTSAILYILTTSEGRDKLFKVLQYSLKLGIWVLCLPNVLPEASQSFIERWSFRLASNVQTIRNGRSMFKLGRWLICMFHLKVVVERLLAKHAPWLVHRVVWWWERAQEMVTSAVMRARGKGKYVSSSSHVAKLVLSPTGCAEHLPQETGDDRGPLSAPPPMPLSSSRTRTVTFGHSGSGENTDAESSPPTTENGSEVLPASYTYASSWRRAVEDFSTTCALILAVRCSASIVRNILRDTIFLSDKQFILMPRVVRNRAALQQLTNKAWVLVSLCDVALNTSRLMDRGWFRYIGSRRNQKLVCMCNNAASASGTCSPRMGMHHNERYVQRKQNVTFPPVDLDYGSVATTTAKIFEAADPARLAPFCNVCGCVLWERSTTGQSTPSLSKQPPPLLIPYLIRQLSDVWWVCSTHSNLTETLLLQARYLCDVFCALGYVFGDYEPVEGEKPLAQHLHVTGSVAGLVSALVALHRVKLSAPS